MNFLLVPFPLFSRAWCGRGHQQVLDQCMGKASFISFRSRASDCIICGGAFFRIQYSSGGGTYNGSLLPQPSCPDHFKVVYTPLQWLDNQKPWIGGGCVWYMGRVLVHSSSTCNNIAGDISPTSAVWGISEVVNAGCATLYILWLLFVINLHTAMNIYQKQWLYGVYLERCSACGFPNSHYSVPHWRSCP